MKKFPHIEQFRSVIKRVQIDHDYVETDENGIAVYDHTTDYPVLQFHGTVKLDGTNGSIGINGDTPFFQSRTRMLGNGTDGNDNQHFASSMNLVLKDERIKNILFPHHDELWFGEWCGQGIQGRTGVSRATRRFVIFDLMRKDSETDEYVRQSASHFISNVEMDILNDAGIWFISQFKSFDVEIDFDKPELAANEMSKIVDLVENECPVAKAFGFDNTLGEGIVWTCVEYPEDSKYWFKTKGEKHEGSRTKTKKVAISPEKLASISDFIEFSCTESRLQQALDFVKSENSGVAEMKHIGQFLKWINSDIARECQLDLEESQLTMKDVGGGISKKSVEWFKNNF